MTLAYPNTPCEPPLPENWAGFPALLPYPIECDLNALPAMFPYGPLLDPTGL
jgi:hypothetical protein